MTLLAHDYVLIFCMIKRFTLVKFKQLRIIFIIIKNVIQYTYTYIHTHICNIVLLIFLYKQNIIRRKKYVYYSFLIIYIKYNRNLNKSLQKNNIIFALLTFLYYL